MPTRLLALLVVCLLAPALRADDSLAAKLDAVIEADAYRPAHWGLLVVDVKTGEPLYAHNPDKLFAPASTTKLYSCAAALVAFGPDHRFVTPVYRRGDLTDGRLKGDLILVAQGDLTFGGRTGKDGKLQFRNADHTYANSTSTDNELTDTDPRAAFDELAKQVKEAGVTFLDGDVLIDDRYFQAARSTGSGPATVSPVIVNDNVIDLLIEPGKEPGDPAKVTVRPETAYVRADIDIRTGKPGSKPTYTDYDLNPSGLAIRGTVPPGKPIVGIVTVERPAELARTMFIEALRRAGVRVTAPLLVPLPNRDPLPKAAEYEKLTKVAAFTSAPFSEAVKVILKVSHNLYASTLPLLVGRSKGEVTLAGGLREQGKVLKGLGVDVSTISFGGGAGGANADKVTPRATVQLLRAMRTRPEWPAYKAALPVLGVDGTLSQISTDSPAKGHVFAKTGTLFWDDALNGRSILTSKALAGVTTAKSGREVAFAVFINDLPLAKGETPTKIGKVLGKLSEIVWEATPASGVTGP
jgi:D-alanyl-D-alanine carboxypeptidase/D-alanyl-D-alanine-endopeptidase (penicillin-binding protein 4)